MRTTRLVAATVACVVLSATSAHAAEPVRLTLGGGASLDFVRVPRGLYTVGSPTSEASRGADEAPHQVTIGHDYLVGQHEVTIAQFRSFTSDTGYRTEAEKGSSGGSGVDGHGGVVQRKEFNWKNPGYPVTDRHPVTIVTFDDAMAFAAWASKQTGHAVSLPTEAQWEVAARGGSDQPYAGQRDSKAALAAGWTKQNAGGVAHVVGERGANGYGVSDTVGNAGEWCRDFFAPYRGGAELDPLVSVAPPGDQPRRVVRGGSFLRDVVNARSASRFRASPGSRNADIGFRVVASVDLAPADASSPAVPSRATPQRPAQPERSHVGLGIAVLVVGLLVFVGVISFVGFIAWLVMKRMARAIGGASASDVKLRPDKDGFWIDAPPGLAGATLRFRAETGAGRREGDVALSGAAGGQFVYTGAPVQSVASLGVATRKGAAAPRKQRRGGGGGGGGGPRYGGGGPRGVHHHDPSPGWNDQHHQPHHHQDEPQAFGGFPSAY